MDELVTALNQAGIPIGLGAQSDITADHGTLVPAHNLASTFPGERIPPVILANPSGLTLQQALAMGMALRNFVHGKRWALLSSGDLSHRLKPGAPSGYHKDGAVFDKAIVEALQKGDSGVLTRLDPSVLRNAGECGLRPTLILLGLGQAPARVFSYEGPFGVGYCNALWSGEGSATATAPQNSAKPRIQPTVTLGSIQPTAKPDLNAQALALARAHAPGPDKGEATRNEPEHNHPYARLARLMVEATVLGKPAPTSEDIAALSPDQNLWNVHKGCFVSIKTTDGALRGCIGTFGPTQPDLAREIMQNAVSASTRDPRFPAMRANELANVDISVDVLNTPEPLQDGMALDPAIWGVIVSKAGRRGLLLPDLPSVTSVADQLSIAARKGGITDLNGAQVLRFTISRYYES
jgi:AmmeMemoRadiSam system protein A